MQGMGFVPAAHHLGAHRKQGLAMEGIGALQARREGLGLGAIDAVLPVGGSSRIPLIRRWLESRCPGVALRGERPVEAVALGALALTPGVRVRDVLARGVSLRCWDRRSSAHRWHPLFMAGQSWPTEQPLELVLACSRDGQEELELVLGEPLPEERAEVRRRADAYWAGLSEEERAAKREALREHRGDGRPALNTMTTYRVRRRSSPGREEASTSMKFFVAARAPCRLAPTPSSA
jgi:hypothetical protein